MLCGVPNKLHLFTNFNGLSHDACLVPNISTEKCTVELYFGSEYQMSDIFHALQLYIKPFLLKEHNMTCTSVVSCFSCEGNNNR